MTPPKCSDIGFNQGIEDGAEWGCFLVVVQLLLANISLTIGEMVYAFIIVLPRWRLAACCELQLLVSTIIVHSEVSSDASLGRTWSTVHYFSLD